MIQQTLICDQPTRSWLVVESDTVALHSFLSLYALSLGIALLAFNDSDTAFSDRTCLSSVRQQKCYSGVAISRSIQHEIGNPFCGSIVLSSSNGGLRWTRQLWSVPAGSLVLLARDNTVRPHLTFCQSEILQCVLT